MLRVGCRYQVTVIRRFIGETFLTFPWRIRHAVKWRFTVRDFNIAYVRETPRSGILLWDNALSLMALSLLLTFPRYDWTCATQSNFHVEKTSSRRMLRSSDGNIRFLWDIHDVSPRPFFKVLVKSINNGIIIADIKHLGTNYYYYYSDSIRSIRFQQKISTSVYSSLLILVY